jgi:curli biogenesis system outer membrane secretion channel CsgG
MRKRTIALIAAAAFIGGVPAGAAAASSTSGATAHASCKSATIGGHHKCIARGQYCARSHQRDYRRYGYSCSRRDRNGRYHLT